MKKIISLFVLFVCLTACGQSAFDKSMRSGKDNLQQGNFQEAIADFDIALIEEPSDKDANLLMDRSKNQLHKFLAKEMLSKYQKEVAISYDEFYKIFLTETVTGKTANGVFEGLAYEDKVKKISSQVTDIGRLYNKYPEITAINSELSDAINRIIDALNEEGKDSAAKYVIAQYHKLATDSMQRYEDKIAALKE